jgi:hypothetical protein
MLKNRTLAILVILSIVVFFSLACAQEVFVYDAKGRRNPFVPLVTSDGRLIKLEAKEVTEGLALEGIIYDKTAMSYAIVNGLVVKVGDFAGGYQVLKIEQNKVIFIKDGQLYEIELKREGA